jgi:NAD(P)-dependent dehydrogenase (short-subunit alcohol dehydrogenase family)
MAGGLKDKLALVTGASRGIGAAAAEALAAAGAHVVITARTEGGLEELEARVHARGGAAMLGDLMPLPHVPPQQFERVMALNVTAQYRLIRAFDPLLRASDAGRIVAVTSSVARDPRAYWGPYAASKAALEALIDSYGQEVRNVSNVRTAVLDPGGTRTKMRAQAFPGEDPATLKTPDVVADAVVAMLHEDFATGARRALGKAA